MIDRKNTAKATQDVKNTEQGRQNLRMQRVIYYDQIGNPQTKCRTKLSIYLKTEEF